MAKQGGPKSSLIYNQLMSFRPQPGILPPPSASAQYLEYRIRPGSAPASLRSLLGGLSPDAGLVAGLGPGLCARLKLRAPGLRPFPKLKARNLRLPSTQQDLWLWLRGGDRGELFHRSRALNQALGTVFEVQSQVEAFVFDGGKDLSGFTDGTENPRGAKAIRAGFDSRGNSFVAVQLWRHDFDKLSRLTSRAQDLAIGRRKRDDKELAGAPAWAHVKRTAQENFQPPAFLLRRSMPWSDGKRGGLMFVAFGRDLDAFEAQWRRMTGQDDGVQDALFRFTKPLTGSYFWCPPVKGGRLDLRGS